MVKAVVVPHMRASHITMIRRKAETKKIERQIANDLEEGRIFKITTN
jgi:hypothetical protein